MQGLENISAAALVVLLAAAMGVGGLLLKLGEVLYRSGSRGQEMRSDILHIRERIDETSSRQDEVNAGVVTSLEKLLQAQAHLSEVIMKVQSDALAHQEVQARITESLFKRLNIIEERTS